MICRTCFGHPVRAVRTGHDTTFVPCAASQAERGGCPDCGDRWVCDTCGGPKPEGETTCNACATEMAICP